MVKAAACACVRARGATGRNGAVIWGVLVWPRAADAAIMDDNGLSAINNRNKKFIIYNLNSSLYASKVVKCGGSIRGGTREEDDEWLSQ